MRGGFQDAFFLPRFLDNIGLGAYGSEHTAVYEIPRLQR